MRQLIPVVDWLVYQLPFTGRGVVLAQPMTDEGEFVTVVAHFEFHGRVVGRVRVAVVVEWYRGVGEGVGEVWIFQVLQERSGT